jgi:hypothetical protein
MALGSTEALTGMSTRNLLGGAGRAARKADNLTAVCEPIVGIALPLYSFCNSLGPPLPPP